MKDPFSLGRTLDPWFETFQPRSVNRVAKVIAVVLVGIMLAGVGVFTGRAVSVVPEPLNCAGDCSGAATYAVDHFKAGDMNRVNGVKPANFYRHPARVRPVWVHKITRAVERYNNHHVLRYRFEGHIVSTDTSIDGSITPSQMYGMDQDAVTCAGISSYPAFTTPSNYCGHTGIKSVNTHGLTKTQVQQGGAAVLCGTGVALMAADGAGILVLILGGSTCMWASWMGIDPG